MKNIVRIDFHKNQDLVIVFVNGYAINRNECNITTAINIARAIGQESIPMTTYGDTIPKKSYIQSRIV